MTWNHLVSSADQTITHPSYRRTISGTICYSWTTLNTGIDSFGSRYCSTGSETQSECQISPCMLFKRMNKWSLQNSYKIIAHLINYVRMPNRPSYTLTCFRTIAVFTLAFQLQVSCQKLFSKILGGNKRDISLYKFELQHNGVWHAYFVKGLPQLLPLTSISSYR